VGDLPVKADAIRGGFLVETKGLEPVDLNDEVTGVLRADWGFQSFDGPQYRLRTPRSGQWIVASKDASALIVGREDTLHVQSPDACCVSGVSLRDEKAKPLKAEWKASKADELEVKVPLGNAEAGSMTMLIHKFGVREPDEIPLHTYAEAARLDSFGVHEGDADGMLKGTRLDEVKTLQLSGIAFDPALLTRANQQDELKLVMHDAASVAKLHAGDALVAGITLKDGRVLDLKTQIEAPRPKVAILTKSIELDQSSSLAIVRLGSAEELPQDGRLNFFLKAQVPQVFSSTEKIEVATSDESFRVLLSFSDGNLTMQDSKTVFAVLDPMKLLGPSAFGPLKFRPVTSDGLEGDWQPLVNLVRIPTLKGYSCVPAPEAQCTLTGDKLFLLDSVSADPNFATSVSVPEGFGAGNLTIPQPKSQTLYIKLRDDPATVDVAVFPTLTEDP
jgi:hypothetical protein